MADAQGSNRTYHYRYRFSPTKAQPGEAAISTDDAIFETYCQRLETHLRRPLTDTERQQLRLTVPLVGQPVAVERRKQPRTADSSAASEDSSKAAD